MLRVPAMRLMSPLRPIAATALTGLVSAALGLTGLAACEACSTPETARETTTAPNAEREVADVQAANARPDAAPPVAAEPPLPPLSRTPSADAAPPDLDALGRYFDAPPLSGAVALWRSGERAAAAQALDNFAIAHPEDARALPARFLSAWVLGDGEPDPTVAARFEALAADWPLMSDACLYHAARAHLADVELDKALATLAKIPSGSVHWGPAQALVARALSDEHRAADARKVLEAAVGAAPDVVPAEGWDLLDALRAEAGDKKGAAAARLELATRYPQTDLGKQALAKLALSELPPERRLTLGAALLDAGRGDATRSVLSGLTSPKDAACRAYVLVGRAWERKKKDEGAADTAFKWYKKALPCEGDARGDATFLGGRNRMRRSDPKQGLKLLKAHVDEFPKRSTADDALQMIANASKRPADVDKGLVKALSRYPGGDMADEIAWDLVGKSITKGTTVRWKEAKQAVDKVLAATDAPPATKHGDRYRYWQARALWELGKKDEARELWRDIVRKDAFTWYALLAYGRLAAEDEAAAKALLLGHAAPAASGPDPRPSKALWSDDHFRRAVEWARLAGPSNPGDGASPLHAFVDAELGAVAAVARGDDWPFTQMTVLELAGAFPRAMRLARATEASKPLPWPAAGSPALRAWKLAYPKPFPELVAKWADARELAPAWVWSIARVESNFDPTAVSWANAIGLMQIIPSTARFLAKDTDIDPTKDALMRPEVALQLGTKYLARLLGKHALYPLASAAYNAGGGAVSRWRNEFGDVPLDEFVERIPYREANNYAKSVTQTLARYLWVYEGQILKLDLAAPGVPKDPTPTEEATPAEPAADVAPDSAESPAGATPGGSPDAIPADAVQGRPGGASPAPAPAALPDKGAPR